MTAKLTAAGPDYSECRGCMGGPVWPDDPRSECGPCMDCGALIHLDDSAYAVDCGAVCVSCGEKIGAPFIAGVLPPPAGSRSYPLWLAEQTAGTP